MPNYPGRRKGTRRVTVYDRVEKKNHEWIVEGTKREADRFEAKKRLELDGVRSSRARAGLSLSELSTAYSEHAARRLGKGTCRVRAFQIASLVEELGEVKVGLMTQAHLEAYQDARLDDGLLATSINNELRVLRTIMLWSARNGHTVAPLHYRMLPELQTRVRAFTEDEMQRLYSAARKKASELLPLLVFLVNTGMRRGEAIAAEWSWVDWRREQITIPCTRFWHPKGKRSRDVPIGDAVRTILQAKRKAGPIFENRFGSHYACWPKDMWERTRDEAQLPGGVHQLRHTFASHFLEAVPDLDVLAEILGHSQKRTTRLYAHMLPGRFARARNAVNLVPALEVQKSGDDSGGAAEMPLSPEKIAARP
jgi:integrase